MANYPKEWFVPPQAVRNNAIDGLERRKEKGGGGLTPKQSSTAGAGGGSIGSGVQRASDLKNANAMSPATMKRMKAFFDRHSAFKEHHDDKMSKAYISWQLWGGDAGRQWATSVVNKMNEFDEKAKEDKKG
jgi:hypothetical protein